MVCLGERFCWRYDSEMNMRNKCKDCAMFASDGSDSASYCLAKDFYTFVKSEDDACDEFVK